MLVNSIVVDSLKTYEMLLREGSTKNEVELWKKKNIILPIIRGVYVKTDQWETWSEREQCIARHVATAYRAPTLTFARESAALLHGIPLLHLPHRIHATTTIKARRSGNTRITYHTTETEVYQRAIRLENTLRATNALDTLVACAKSMPLIDACCIADAMMNKELVPAPAAAQALNGVTSRQGASRAHKVAETMDSRAGSIAETITRIHLMRHGFPVPIIKYAFTQQSRTYYGDFVWEDARLILHLDGRAKHYGTGISPTEQELTAENAVEKVARNQGWRVVRAQWEDIYPTSTGLRNILLPYLNPDYFPSHRIH